jgi:quinol monooxygenase YgiN
MMDGRRGHGWLWRLRVQPGEEAAVAKHLERWHRTAGRLLPGTRLHLLFELTEDAGALALLHLFESAAAYRRAAAAAEQRAWEEGLADLLAAPAERQEVRVRWNAATDARPRVAVSIDRDVHAAVQDLIGRLLERHPRTPAEELYLNLLQSIAADYEAEYPLVAPEEEDIR